MYHTSVQFDPLPFDIAEIYFLLWRENVGARGFRERRRRGTLLLRPDGSRAKQCGNQ